MLNKETKFYDQLDENSIHNLSINIFYTNNWLLEKYKTILNKFRLKYNQYYILKTLSKSYPKPIPMYLIHHSIIDKNINLSRVIDTLFNLDLVHRNQSNDDRRVVDVLLTQKGVKLLEEIEAMLKKFENSQNEQDYEEAINLNNLLNNFRESKKKIFNYK